MKRRPGRTANQPNAFLDDAADGKVTPKEARVTVQKQVEAVIKR